MSKYLPTMPPEDKEQLLEWLRAEFQLVALALRQPDIHQYTVTNVAPPKPQEGNVAFADGVNWNPGSGRGVYEYRSGAWQKL